MKVHATQFAAAAEPFLNRTQLHHRSWFGGYEEVTRNSFDS
jgi:hypothetical protein